MNISPVYRALYFFLHNLNAFYFFSFLIALTRTSSTMLIISDESGHLVSCLNLGRSIKDDVSCGFVCFFLW